MEVISDEYAEKANGREEASIKGLAPERTEFNTEARLIQQELLSGKIIPEILAKAGDPEIQKNKAESPDTIFFRINCLFYGQYVFFSIYILTMLPGVPERN